MTSRKDVVITGLGIVGAAGLGRQALLDAFRRGSVGPCTVDRSEGFHRSGGATRAALIGRFSCTDWIPPLLARRMSPPSRFAVVAARTALADAGIEPPEQPDPELGVVAGSAFGPSSYSQRLLDQLIDEGPEAASPAVFTECVANAPAGQIAIHCRAAGPNYTLAAREASPVLALIRGSREIRAGRAGTALAGAVDEMPPLLHAVLDRFGTLARSEHEEDHALPFDRRRTGCLATEGSTFLVLEPETGAAARGEEPVARVIASGRAFDATATPAGWGTGAERLGDALRSNLAEAGVALDGIDLILSGASGSRNGDRLEARTLRRAWGDVPLPPVLTPKAVTGEYGGGLLAPAVMAFESPGLPVPPQAIEIDPDLDIAPYRGYSSRQPSRLLVTALAAGGTAAWVVLGKP